jgi:hypothetical protein
MSHTIWKPLGDLIESLTIATELPREEVRAALTFIAVRATDAPFFMSEHAPFVPLLIELSDMYMLSPVSGIFSNPFTGIKLLRESTSSAVQAAMREHQEQWMVDDLYALFEGSRFQRASARLKLRKDGRILTDIDAAIFDNVSGELVIFQLKWQDFGSSSPRKQRSKAKNFIDQVDDWTRTVTSWIDQFGAEALCNKLQFKLPIGARPRTIRLIAIGRSNARFRSYGYFPTTPTLVLPWPQLVRMRYSIGPNKDFFELLALRVADEARAPIKRNPLPYVLKVDGSKITFKDIWNEFDDSEWNLPSEFGN